MELPDDCSTEIFVIIFPFPPLIGHIMHVFIYRIYVALNQVETLERVVGA
jgi:hypothetical protein